MTHTSSEPIGMAALTTFSSKNLPFSIQPPDPCFNRRVRTGSFAAFAWRAGKSISGRSRSLMPIPGGLPAEAIDGSTLLSAIAGDVDLDNRRSGRQRLAGRTTGVDLLRAVLSAQPIIFSCHSNRTCHRRREFRRGSIPPTFVSGNFQCVGFFRIR
jgi:hypothetical protein